MPVIIPPIEYDRWLSTLDPDPHDLLVPFPSDPMTLWPVSTRVNKPTNDDASILNLLKPQVGEVRLQSLPLDVGVD
jgi:putative SOS response-associated peptidase YedK